MSSFAEQIMTGLKPLDHKPRKTSRKPDIHNPKTRHYEWRPVTEQQIIHLIDEAVGMSRFDLADALCMNPDYLVTILYSMRKRGLIHNVLLNRGHEPAIWHTGARL